MRIAAVLVSAVTIVQSAWGWGATGHQTIARIAQVHLNNRAATEIAKLLEENESIVTVASWADTVRPQRKETSTWHYINIPVWVQKGDWSPYCPAEGCVVRKVKELIAFLKSGEGDRTARAEALKYLIHFMGDMHQPLHVGDRKDRGGNDTPVVYFDKATNLHSVWDTPVVERLFEREPQLKAAVNERMSLDQRRALEAGMIDDWAWESQAVAATVAYRYLTSPSPAVLGPDYQAQAEVAAWVQLRKGGVRLARVLNEIWPE
jgi:hypothetical protein